MLLAWAAVAAPAQGAFPGEDGKIALTRYVCDGSQPCGDYLYTVNPDGSDPTQIAFSGRHAAWSADGLELAFTDGTKVYTVNPNGTGMTTVLDWGASVGGLAWAPDGQRLAAALETCEGGDCRTDIFTFNLDGTGMTDLTPDLIDDRDPSWSPDGSRIAFDTARNGDYEVFVVNPDGTGLTDLTNTPGTDRNPSWSPGGSLIAYTKSTGDRSDIYTMNENGSAQSRLTSSGSGQFKEAPAWSPEGFEIAITGVDVIDVFSRSETHIATGSDPDWQPKPGSLTQTGYPRPRGATPLLTYLVPASKPCDAPNSAHSAPLAFPSCSPPSRESGTLTVGTPDANGLAARSVGTVLLQVVRGNPSTTQDEADVEIRFGITDVRWASNLLPYNGEVSLRTLLRITDTDNPSGNASAAGTMTDVPLSFTAPCNAGTCGIDTTTDSLAPGTAKEGRRAIWELGPVQVYDGGPDADTGTEPNSLFETQGLFVP